MNLLLISENDFVTPDTVVVRGEQAKHILKIKKSGVGDRLALGVLNGSMGEGELLRVSKGEIELKVHLSDSSGPPSSHTSLVVALPRPQILKNVLFTSAMFGVEQIFFVGSARTEKSYFLSKMLTTDNINRYLRYGLEQAVATRAPVISIVERFSDLSEKLSRDTETFQKRVLLDPRGSVSFSSALNESNFSSQSRLLLGIGPEGGWQDHEIQALKGGGFETCHLGQRIFRVDTAVTALLGMVDYARQLKVETTIK